MATRKLDLGKVKGENGTNGLPSKIEVFTDTPTTYILKFTYYDENNVQHVSYSDNLRGAMGSATFTVTNDTDLQNWMDAAEGFDFTHVIVKPANYTLSGVLKLEEAGTEMISGFGADLPNIEVRGSGREMAIGLTAQKFTDMLAVASDAKVLIEALSTSLTDISNGDAFATPATASNYDKVRYAEAGSGTSIANVDSEKLGTAVRAEQNPEETLPTVFYVQGDGNDYILKGTTKVVAAAASIITANVKRVLVHKDSSDYLHLHVLTTDGNLYHVYEQLDQIGEDPSETEVRLHYTHIEENLPAGIIDIMYSPQTDWTSLNPYPAMLTETHLYITPNISATLQNYVPDFTPVRCLTVGLTTGTGVTFALRKSGGGLASAYYDVNLGSFAIAALAAVVPGSADVFAGGGQLLVNNNGVLKEITGLDGTAAYTEITVEASTAIFYDGFDKGAFKDAHFTEINGNWISNSGCFDGNILAVSFPVLSSGTAYIKLTDWQGTSGATGGIAITPDGSALAFIMLSTTPESFSPDVSASLFREHKVYETGVGFSEIDNTEGIEVYKTGNGSEFLPRKVMFSGNIFTPKQGQDRWLRFDPTDRQGLVIQKGVTISGTISDHEVTRYLNEDMHFHIEDLMEGTDFYAVLEYDGTDFSMVAKTAAEIEEGDVVAGRFHTVCVDYGTLTHNPDNNLGMQMRAAKSSASVGDYVMVKPYHEDTDPDFYAFYRKQVAAVNSSCTNYDLITVPHPLAGFEAGDIIPESVWCKDFFPASLVDDAMVFDADTGKAIDIYLQSGTGPDTRSAYNKRVTVARTPKLHSYDMADVGKNLLTDWEFTCATKGSNERTNIVGSAAPNPKNAGGHVDTLTSPTRRMVSAIGCEDMCGFLWQWLDELGLVGDNTSGWTTNADSDAKFGQDYGLPYVLLAGGSWDGGVRCGSGARDAAGLRSGAIGHGGGRGSSRVLHGSRGAA